MRPFDYGLCSGQVDISERFLKCYYGRLAESRDRGQGELAIRWFPANTSTAKHGNHIKTAAPDRSGDPTTSITAAAGHPVDTTVTRHSRSESTATGGQQDIRIRTRSLRESNHMSIKLTKKKIRFIKPLPWVLPSSLLFRDSGKTWAVITIKHVCLRG